MAVLSSATTSGESSFNKYVANNSSWQDLELVIENNLEATFYTLNKQSSHGVLPSGESLTLASNRQETIGRLMVAKVTSRGRTGYVALNKIRKPTRSNVLAAETAAMDHLNERLSEIVREIGAITINTPTGPIQDCVGAVNVTEKVNGREAKADFAIVNSRGNKVLFISHKKAGGARAYQQYGGLTSRAGSQAPPRLIYDNPEVQEIFRVVSERIVDERLTNPVYKLVSDGTLMMQSIYGASYGSAFSIDNVHVIGQGNAVLTRQMESTYSFTFSEHTRWNGNAIHSNDQDGYRPVLGATYRAGRGFDVDGTRYSGARVAIYPLDFIQNRSNVERV